MLHGGTGSGVYQYQYMEVLVVGYTNTSKRVCVQLTRDAIDFRENWVHYNWL